MPHGGSQLGAGRRRVSVTRRLELESRFGGGPVLASRGGPVLASGEVLVVARDATAAEVPATVTLAGDPTVTSPLVQRLLTGEQDRRTFRTRRCAEVHNMVSVSVPDAIIAQIVPELKGRWNVADVECVRRDEPAAEVLEAAERALERSQKFASSRRDK